MAEHPTRLVCVGVVAAAHGVRGQVKIKPFTESPDTLSEYETLLSEDGRIAYSITVTGRTKGHLIAVIEGVDDRNEAEKLRGTHFYVSRDSLPPLGDEDEFYYEDLVGMQVVDMQGVDFGIVRQVSNHGAGDLLEIALAKGGSKDYVFNKATFPEVDMKRRRITFVPPEEIEAEQ